MRAAAWTASAFAVGTLPSPYLVALAAGRRDIIEQMRRQDSPGDAHFLVARRMSKALGVIAIILDMLKGFGPALAARLLDEPVHILALVGVATVSGHSFAPFLRRAGGRGLTTAAGVALVLVPWAMVAAGVISLVGTVTRQGGLGTSIGFGLLPAFAAAVRYDGLLIAMCAGMVILIMIRRLEGIEEDRREGIPFGRAIAGRLLFDLPRGRRK